MAMHRSETYEPRAHRLTAEDYYRMAEVGILGPDERLELIDGEIIDMAPPGELHTGTVLQLDRLLQRTLGDRCIVLCQSPTLLGRYSLPQPALYAEHGIPEYWLIDVRGKRLTRHRDPSAEGYARVDEPDLGAPVEVPGIAGVSVALAALFAD